MKVIWKRLCSLLMACVMLFGLAACGQTSQTTEEPQEPAETDQTAEAAPTD